MESLTRIQELGADAVIDLRKPDEEVMDEFQKQAGDGYDVILDFLWGHPTELLIKHWSPASFRIPKAIRLIQIGEKAGSSIPSLPMRSGHPGSKSLEARQASLRKRWRRGQTWSGI